MTYKMTLRFWVLGIVLVLTAGGAQHLQAQQNQPGRHELRWLGRTPVNDDAVFKELLWFRHSKSWRYGGHALDLNIAEPTSNSHLFFGRYIGGLSLPKSTGSVVPIPWVDDLKVLAGMAWEPFLLGRLLGIGVDIRPGFDFMIHLNLLRTFTSVGQDHALILANTAYAIERHDLRMLLYAELEWHAATDHDPHDHFVRIGGDWDLSYAIEKNTGVYIGGALLVGRDRVHRRIRLAANEKPAKSSLNLEFSCKLDL